VSAPILSGQTVAMSPAPPWVGAIQAPCSRCDAATWLGPRLQAVWREHPDAVVVCIPCAALDADLMATAEQRSMGNVAAPPEAN
jgi:hypothetical protein